MSSDDVNQSEERMDHRRDTWFHVLYAVVWPFFHLFRPIKAVGKENIPEGAAVLCPNHTTIGDPFYVVYAFGWNCPMRAMAKIQLMKVPVIGWILSKAGVFGVDRGHADMKAVKTALKFLKNGNKLLMFPEGTRVHEGENVAAKTGAAMFATRTGVPIVPIHIQTPKKLFRRNLVVIGEPYYPQFKGRKPTADELDQITQEMMRRIHDLGVQQ